MQPVYREPFPGQEVTKFDTRVISVVPDPLLAQIKELPKYGTFELDEVALAELVQDKGNQISDSVRDFLARKVFCTVNPALSTAQ